MIWHPAFKLIPQAYSESQQMFENWNVAPKKGENRLNIKNAVLTSNKMVSFLNLELQLQILLLLHGSVYFRPRLLKFYNM